MKNTLLALVLGGLFTGCASTEIPLQSNEPVKPVSMENCCSEFSDFNWTKLDRSEDIEFQIDDSSPVWSFAEGKSFFNAFEFAQQTKKVELTLISHMLEGSVFAPKMATLDSQFNIVNEFELDTFKIFHSDALIPNRYELKLALNAEETPYFIIYSSLQEINDSIVIPHPAKVRAINSGDALPMVTDLKYLHSYTGQLALNINTLSLSSHSERNRKTATVVVKKAQTDTITYYTSSIQKAVKNNDIPKALALLDEAKALGIKDAQQVFVDAVNAPKQ